ncbi:DMT family transporter [Aliivibrio finisterrensis]|uniref:DMT family transporter n=1 Tax=Aliivibrio finisterrensis TaxID=511998 RepID=A0A6N6RUX4_9GAMM|nr:DMT family transporter [Aliivibrio finisterrensis]KAB2825480.1 DMT family transporter [Aliivibrio finisterrensis]
MERRIERGRELSVNQYLPSVILLLVAFFWGTSYGVAKEALLFTSVLVFLVIRFVITTLVLLPIVIYRKNITHWKSVIPTGFILFLIFVCETYGIKNTTASNAAFLISLFVVFTPFVEWVVNKNKPTNKLLFLSIISVIGVFLLTNMTTHELTINMGDILMLMAALLRGVMVVFTKKVMVDKDVDPIMVTSIQSSVVSIFSIILLLSIHGFEWVYLIPLDLSFWLLAIYLVLFCTVFAFYAQNYSVKKMSPTKVSILMGSEPIFGALFAFLWLSESFTIVQIIGASLIFIATFIATRQEAKV